MQKKMNRPTSSGTEKAPFSNASDTVQSPEIDQKILLAFKESYVYKTFLNMDSIKISSENGIVTLTGTVTDESHKELAKATISKLYGVVRVENQLVTPSESEAENADKWIGRKVKLSLLFHFHVSARVTKIEVKDRVVTLRGEATSMAQKELTAEYAGDIEGVKSVINKMTLIPPPPPAKRTSEAKMDDASIFAQVYTALLTHRSTSTLQIRVEVIDGHVSLTGISRNPAERTLVSKLVSEIHGVNGVNNQMTIQEPKSL